MKARASATAAMLLVACGVHAATMLRTLDSFEQLAPWQVQHTDDVGARLSSVAGKTGNALRLDFDFDHVNGYATARRALSLDLPPNYELSFWVRGKAPVNNLQFKLIDASGENVWWLNQPDYVFTPEWRQVRIAKRQLEFAWGPTSDRELKHSAAIEFVVSSGRDGGKGAVDFDALTLRELPPPDASPLRPQHVAASSALQGFPAAAAMDGDATTAWRSNPAQGSEQHFDIDLGKPREIGAIALRWHHGERATSYQINQSNDGKAWHGCGGAHSRRGDDTAEELCDSETRYLRLLLHCSDSGRYGINEIQIKGPAWAATRNEFFRNIAKDAPRGTYPRGFIEQPYWTIVGVDGGGTPALISEDGAIEPRKGGWSIEPFLFVDQRRLTWADVSVTQSLLEGYLPMPGVEWTGAALKLRVDAFARGTREAPQLIARYRVANTRDAAADVTLQLAIRPFQVNPPAQFLNSPGGVAYIQSLNWDGSALRLNDGMVRPLTLPDDFVLLSDDGSVDEERPVPRADGTRGAYDELGQLSGALVYKLHLPPGGDREIDLVASMLAGSAPPDVGADTNAWVERERNAVAAHWRSRLNRVTLTLPAAAQRIADSLRTALAHILISRDGAALRPGTRSYARSWIRDGAMMADALLRLDETDAVRDYVHWYAPHQFANGKVPCCVDHRGSDPVPENDSHGELIHAIAQLYRFGGDRPELEKNWPHVQAAITYTDSLRAGETGAANPALKGLLPASISHEGYSAKPMHSYWDDFWALTGYKDAAAMAQVLGSPDAARFALARDAFAGDLHASIAAATQAQAIDYVPGCAELGDFDATSTTIALEPAGEESKLPGDLMRNTFERYWREFVARRDGAKPWEDYTPYEWRTVGSFVRLGWRERAQELIDFFFATGARPPAWNQWAEVVGHDARKPRFIGDMPHAWVASDFIRAALDLFAYARGDALVLAAGVPESWLDEGIAVEHLRTPFGDLTYHLQRAGRRLELRIAAGIKPPGGFLLPWPLAGQPGATHINGSPARWQSGELHVAAAPAAITIDLGTN